MERANNKNDLGRLASLEDRLSRIVNAWDSGGASKAAAEIASARALLAEEGSRASGLATLRRDLVREMLPSGYLLRRLRFDVNRHLSRPDRAFGSSHALVNADELDRVLRRLETIRDAVALSDEENLPGSRRADRQEEPGGALPA